MARIAVGIPSLEHMTQALAAFPPVPLRNRLPLTVSPGFGNRSA